MRDGTYQFDEFHLDASRFQLRCHGEELRLEKKPMELLLLLAASGGRVVTRSEIAAHLWGAEVFVDTEHGINTAVRKVRAALGESSESPRFIQTVPGMGYRFAGTVVRLVETVTPPVAVAAVATPAPPDVPAVAEVSEPKAPRLSWQRWVFAGLGVVVGIALLLSVRVWLHRNRAAAPLASQVSGIPQKAGAGSEADLPEEARDQYQRGLYLLDRRNVIGSTAAFRRAVALAPNYAPAWAGLAQALDGEAKLSDGVPGTLVPEATEAARKAIALDPGYDGGYVALGMLQTAFTWEWKDAAKNLQRGLELNPGNAMGRIWYAVLLQSTGRQEQAIDEAQKAVAAAPLSFFMVRMQGSVLYYAHRYDNALRALTRAQEMTPQHPNVVDNWMAWVQEQRGLYDDAVQHDLLALQQNVTATDIAKLRQTYRQTGWRGYWRARLAMLRAEPQHGCRNYAVGLAAVRVGDRDGALLSLRRAAEQHCFWLGMIGTDPGLDPLREDSRFRQIERLVEGNASRGEK